MVRGFQITAAAFALIALFFLWEQNRDGVFVTLVLAASSYFLSVRYAAKERLTAHQAEIASAATEE